MDEKGTEEHQAHFNLFIEYIRKTDMMQGSYYMQMYNNFSEVQYSFGEFPKISNEQQQDNKEDAQINENQAKSSDK